ncbi:MAG: twin-arginine translocase subunit TatC [Crocinitomicaceae bacterium]|nr:twin-arginine translocase subunit TatC [Crocinitomicaceae bacterium]
MKVDRIGLLFLCYYMEEEKNMSFLDHLEELRWRLVRSAIAVLIFAIAIWCVHGWMIENLFLSMRSPDFISFRLLCDFLGVCVEEIDIEKYISTTVTGQFSYALMISVMGGIVAAFPYIFYQIWSFVKPGLKTAEKSVAKGLVFYVSMLFFIGIAFGYFIVAPLCIQFFGNFKITDQIENTFTINSFMSMVLSTVFYSGLLFLLPVVTYIFSKLGVLSSAFLKKYRRHAIVGILILSALITPPDLISQVIVGIPILILYEIGVFIASRMEKKV